MTWVKTEIQKEGKCPKCGSEHISYKDQNIDETGVIIEACCENCDTNFREFYDVIYSESRIKKD